MVSTIAGGSGEGLVDGQGKTALFKSPVAIAMDAWGFSMWQIRGIMQSERYRLMEW